jgi:two-component system, OmpR family, sensor histidine kinase MprB
MTLGRRLTLVSAVAVAVTIAAASAVVFLVVRGQLRDQVDGSLRELAGRATLFGTTLPAPPPLLDRAVQRRGEIGIAFREQSPGDPGGYGQLVRKNGEILVTPGGSAPLPVSAETREVAAGEREAFYEDLDLQGTHMRVFTTPLGNGEAVQVARSLDEVDATLGKLGVLLAAVALAGVALAAVLGRAISRTAIRPVARLTAAAEHVGRTGDLSSRIEVAREDEIGRLAASFNEMLAELEVAVSAQRQLVADASHELRTPLTSLRTNIETLARPNGLPHGDRHQLLADVVAQLGELSTLVANLVDLARDEQPEAVREDIRLDELVADAVASARRHAPDRRFLTRLEPCLVHGVAERLDRAVANLLDNAAKWSPAGGEIEVGVSSAGEVTVRDHGPGIDPDDLPRVFDRFYRAASVRSMAGSGLGLAIVRQVADDHGGTVSASSAPGGGTLLRLRIPALAAAPQPVAS